MGNVFQIHEPTTYKIACKDENWTKAIQNEIKALEDNETWTITELLKDKRAIGCKCIFKIKYKADGTVDRYKARLVAKGYSQIEGIHYHESFLPVAKLVTVRILIALATAKGWNIHQLDINNALLHGYLHEEVYMQSPKGYTKVKAGQVC